MRKEDIFEILNTSPAEADLVLVTGAPPMLRSHDAMQIVEGCGPIHSEDAEPLLHECFPEGRPDTQQTYSHDARFGMVDSASGQRARVHAVSAGGIESIVVRLIREDYLDSGVGGIADAIELFSAPAPATVTLVAGLPRSGRTIALARIIRNIKRDRPVHIATRETCAEIELASPDRVVTRFDEGVEEYDAFDAITAMRPDVLVVDTVDSDSDIEEAVELAENGSQVFLVTRARDTQDAIENLLRPWLGSESPLRDRFAAVFRGCLALRMLNAVDGGCIVASEVCVAVPAVKGLIRDRHDHQLPAQIQVGAQFGMRIMSESLAKLVNDGKVSLEEAMRGEPLPDRLQRYLDQGT